MPCFHRAGQIVSDDVGQFFILIKSSGLIKKYMCKMIVIDSQLDHGGKYGNEWMKLLRKIVKHS